MSRKTRTIPTSTTRFSAAIRYRKVPDTPVPISPVTECSVEPSSCTWPASARTPSAKSSARTKTTVECPSEKKNPTLSGRWPSPMNLRVVLSIAAMWSASNAWRSPSVYAVRPTPAVNAPPAPRLK